MDKKRREQIIEQLKQLSPGSVEFKRLLLEISESSDHPKDEAASKVLRRWIAEAEGTRPVRSPDEIRREKLLKIEHVLCKILKKVRRPRTLYELIDELWPPDKIPGYRDPAKYKHYSPAQRSNREKWTLTTVSGIAKGENSDGA